MSAPRLAGVREPGLRRAGAQTGGTGGTGGGSSNAVDVGIADAGNHFASTNVEGALTELATAGAGGGTLAADLASSAAGKGATLVSTVDPALMLSGAQPTVDASLVGLSGAMDNAFTAIGAAQTDATTALASAASASASAAANATAIATNAAAVALRTKIADLISQAGGLGASLVGYNNAGGFIPGIYAATLQDVLTYMAVTKVTPILQGGTGKTTAPEAFDALSIKAPDIASAATIDLSVASCPGNYVVITGATGPVTSFGIAPAGTARVLRFASTPTLTHNAASLILPGGANIVAAAGDVMFVHSLGAGNWRCTSYMRASSLPALAADLASVAAALGASLIGIQDAGGLITATTVEGALAELATGAGPRLLAAVLGDASVTIAVGTASEFTLPNATLTANRTITLSTTCAVAGEVLRVIRRDATAFTLALVNGGVGAGTMYTFPVSVKRVADFQFDGINWGLVGHAGLL